MRRGPGGSPGPRNGLWFVSRAGTSLAGAHLSTVGHRKASRGHRKASSKRVARRRRAVEEAGDGQPTPIRQDAMPLALAGRDLIGSAQTGTGKTAAFMLPILQRLANAGAHHVLRALILVPTRELAEQVLQSARVYGRHVRGVTAAAVYGGVGMEPQTKALRHGADIIVATPGRLLDHMERGHVDFSRLEVLVLDE